MNDLVFKVGKQPCYNLKRQPGCIPAAPEIPNEHQCPVCGSTTTFCENCGWDHHKDGWDSCRKGTGIRPRMQPDEMDEEE